MTIQKAVFIIRQTLTGWRKHQYPIILKYHFLQLFLGKTDEKLQKKPKKLLQNLAKKKIDQNFVKITLAQKSTDNLK